MRNERNRMERMRVDRDGTGLYEDSGDGEIGERARAVWIGKNVLVYLSSRNLIGTGYN